MFSNVEVELVLDPFGEISYVLVDGKVYTPEPFQNAEKVHVKTVQPTYTRAGNHLNVVLERVRPNGERMECPGLPHTQIDPGNFMYLQHAQRYTQ